MFRGVDWLLVLQVDLHRELEVGKLLVLAVTQLIDGDLLDYDTRRREDLLALELSIDPLVPAAEVVKDICYDALACACRSTQHQHCTVRRYDTSLAAEDARKVPRNEQQAKDEV